MLLLLFLVGVVMCCEYGRVGCVVVVVVVFFFFKVKSATVVVVVVHLLCISINIQVSK
jgi:hypothetical protein